ncbi:ligand-binding sensor domain-containing protein [Chryseosolibacter indicus]|uniref:histidine kinase n=1 Tax=Chryseosolibacter indicus TaxID=2782351 RepID=A0ABS5VJT1_9BACT|nr:two-component regulator propeller domain-containing protein [Chryseosolibacter indicus]MBT1701694.1 hypothetical protein [Chryseosolibacter indicus]
MRKFYILLVLLFNTIVSFCQLPFFQQYHLKKKNETLNVNAILQDSEGVMWIGTTEGLFQFDTRRRYHYSLNDSLANLNVTALAEDNEGRIWIGHQDGSISVFSQGRFEKFEPYEGVPTEAISDILFDSKGTMWLGTRNDGLYYYQNKRLFRLDEEEGMPDLFIYNIDEDSEGNIWAGTDRGIVKCTFKDKRVMVTTFSQASGSLPDNIVTHVVRGVYPYLFMSTDSQGILSFNTVTGESKLISPSWSYGSINDFVVSGHNIWISSSEGLVVVDYVINNTKVYRPGVKFNLGMINVLGSDFEGNIWVGTKTGLFRIPGDEIEFIRDFTPEIEQDILAVTEDHEKQLWFSNKQGLFKREQDLKGKVKYINLLANTRYSKYQVISLYTDTRGKIWAGFYGEGVLMIDPVSLQITHIENELRNGNVLSITGKGDEVWLATLGGVTQIQYSGNGLKFENYSIKNGLASDFIYKVFIDSKNRKWFGTDGRGVCMFDGSAFHRFERGLPSKVVYDITEDSSGAVYANVQGNGIYRLDVNKKKFFSVKALTLRDHNVQCLATDKNGHLMMMHDLGIDVFRPNKLNLYSIGEEKGLREKFPALNAWNRTLSGDLLYATSDGIVKYHATTDTVPSAPKPLLISLKILDKLIDVKNKHVFSYNENNLIFNIFAIWYKNPEAVQFQYMLENYDNNWIATRDQSITYSRIPPGNYVFRLRASATEDFTEAKEITYAFVIDSPFWKTPPFFMLCFVALLISGYAFIKFRERKLRYDNLILEAKVQRRTLEIQRQSEEIQAQNEEILAQAEEINGINENLEQIVRERTADLERKTQALEEYAFINAHKLRSPVASILGLANLLSKTKLDDEGLEINRRLTQKTEELDTIVRSITKALEKGDGHFLL